MIITLDGNIPSKWAHSINVMKMAQGFYQAGENVTVVSFLSIPNIIEALKVGNINKYYGITNKVKLKFIHSFDSNFFQLTKGALRYFRRVALYAQAKKTNFVYSRSINIPAHCMKFNIPVIVESHNTGIFEKESMKKMYDYANKESFLGFVTIHDYFKQELIKRGIPEEKILVLEDGVDLEKFQLNDDRYFWKKKLGIPNNKKIIMYTGSLFKEKGIEHILLTAKKLEQKETIFVLVGGRKEQIKQWRLYCTKQKINNVIFKGYINNSKIPSYLKAADILMMPYDATLDCEIMDLNITSPLKLFEYMAAKRPIISTNIPTIAKIVTHNHTALLAESGNIDMLAEYVKELLNNPVKSDFLANNAYDIVQNYTWENRCRKILDKFVVGNKICE